MAKSKSQKKALSALNYDLFEPKDITPPAPATIDSKLAEHRSKQSIESLAPTTVFDITSGTTTNNELPDEKELYNLFDRYNWLYFQGKLPQVRIEYSNRMTNAGSYTPAYKLIKISRKYHEIFPEDLHDTLKHEMIHILHYRHDAAFKKEAARLGCSIKAKSHPSLRRKTKYLYVCPHCEREYPRRKRIRLASCGYCSAKGEYDERFKLQLLKSDK